MKAICRVAKVKGSGSISGKSEHNYRQGQVPNADLERQHLNKEYVLNYENLGKAIQARIEHAGIERVRQDAVKGMEFILTASPERFKRDDTGQVTDDYRNSQWVAANLKFMKEKYGPNLVAFTLHQDEKTPHIHAIVVPITADKRLCAKELFTPKTLRQLQTDYATAMKPFGLERGMRGSRAIHKTMKQIYGLQQQERQTIEQELKAVQKPTEPLQIDQPSVLDLLNLDRWKKEQEAKINAEFNRRLAELENVAQQAQKAAIANVQAKEQVQVLQQRLETSEKLKQSNFEQAQQANQKLSNSNQLLEKVALLIDEKRLNPSWSQKTAQQVRDRVLPQIENDVVEAVNAIKSRDTIKASQEFFDHLIQKGYQVNTGQSRVTELKSGVEVNLIQSEFKGQHIVQLVKQRQEQLEQQEQKLTLKQQPTLRQRRGPRL